MTEPRKFCRHCARRVACRAAGLCWACSRALEIRALYSPRAAVLHVDHGGRLLPAEPTDACPGTPRKLEVLRSRVERNQQLYHPLDATGAEGRFPHDLLPSNNRRVEMQTEMEDGDA